MDPGVPPKMRSKILQTFPIVFESSKNLQELFLLYIFSLHKLRDVVSMLPNMRRLPLSDHNSREYFYPKLF